MEDAEKKSTITESACGSSSGGTDPHGADAAAGVNGPPCVLVLGMAGSGKTSFVQRLTAHLHAQRRFPYLMNLDPATTLVPFPANIDIRDTIDYKGVMKDYSLGPNGAILTSLNLFCTRFNQVLDLLEKRRGSVPLIVVDTPGQIEAFTWSASGAIITDSLAGSFPTMVAYVVDLARSANPTTFMSNMLYKSDVTNPDIAVRWMTDFEAFQDALDDNSSSYMNDLTRSLSLVLDSFYEHLNWVAVSSHTGAGFDKLMGVIEKCQQEYQDVYRPMCDKLAKDRKEMEEKFSTEKLANMTIAEREEKLEDVTKQNVEK